MRVNTVNAAMEISRAAADLVSTMLACDASSPYACTVRRPVKLSTMAWERSPTARRSAA